MKNITPLLAVVGALGVLAPVSARADSISPASLDLTLGVGESTTIKKTVTVSAGRPTSSKVDVFFLADTTGSMGTAINAVKTSASSIMTTAAGLGDVQFAVGEYKDVGDIIVYRRNQDITGNTAAVQTGINAWFAGGGGDEPEANMFGLQEAANTTAWRSGSARVLVWFGDAPGHDPRAGATEASATAALVAKGIKVEAISVGANRLNLTGQAQRIATATGGALFSGVNQAAIVAAINGAITSAFDTYSTVSLDLSEVPVGVSVSALPASHSGSYDRSIDRTFNFDVTFTGDAPGDYNFNIYGTVDGGRVATEKDHVLVRGHDGVPDGGSTLMLLGGVATALVGLRRRLNA
jgi:hypothetical protein